MANGASISPVLRVKLKHFGLIAVAMFLLVACNSGSANTTPSTTCIPAPVALQPGSLIAPAPGATGVPATIGQISLTAYSVSTITGAKVVLAPTNGGAVISSTAVIASGTNTYIATIPALSSGVTYRAQFTYDPGAITCHVFNTTDLGTFTTQ